MKKSGISITFTIMTIILGIIMAYKYPVMEDLLKLTSKITFHVSPTVKATKYQESIEKNGLEFSIEDIAYAEKITSNSMNVKPNANYIVLKYKIRNITTIEKNITSVPSLIFIKEKSSKENVIGTPIASKNYFLAYEKANGIVAYPILPNKQYSVTTVKGETIPMEKLETYKMINVDKLDF